MTVEITYVDFVLQKNPVQLKTWKLLVRNFSFLLYLYSLSKFCVKKCRFLFLFLFFTENKSCQTVIQVVYRTSKNTIRCDYQDQDLAKFFCKENKESICEEISSHGPKSNEAFSLKRTNTGINVTISSVSPEDEGVYWCGEKKKDGRYRAGVKKVKLQFKGEEFTSSALKN